MRGIFSRRQLPFFTTFAVFVILYTAAGMKYDGFASLQNFVNLLGDNAFLGIAAVGMTFVIISGGIDLSVGAVVAFVSVFIAVLVENLKLHPLIVIPLSLLIGAGFGGVMGSIVHFFGLPPFLVTLAGMFFARGMGYVLSLDSFPLTHDFYSKVSAFYWEIGEAAGVPLVAMIFAAVVVVAMIIAHHTSFGRNVYAIGGNEDAALLMGLPVARTKVCVYAFSGFCSALAGVVYTIYSASGYPNAAVGLELDAIAAAVIGGTLLSGGVGYVAGTLVGVLIFGIIQTAIMFQGTLSSWWTRIAVGMLLLVFLLLQKALARTTTR